MLQWSDLGPVVALAPSRKPLQGFRQRTGTMCPPWPWTWPGMQRFPVASPPPLCGPSPMPTITLQVGQCGNQLGSSLWKLYDRQAAAADAKSTTAAGCVAGCDSEYFREDRNGSRVARCLLVDTEPKVVNGLVGKQGHKLFSAGRCFIGQSGRGNNWAFGYSQLLPSRNATGLVPGKDWDSRTHTQEPDAQEARMLQDVMEGVRLEAEASDTAPNFLLLHSLGGGSGSGLGSRILESVREEFALNYIATISVAPRTAGDSPMQSLNSVMALSFLQSYADVVMLYNNTDLLNRACKGGKSASMMDVNQYIAQSALGALWPMDAGEVASANPRIRDLACTVAADPCLKLVETHTAMMTSTLGAQGSWQEGFKMLNHMQGRYDIMDGNAAVVVSSALLLGRGLPAEALNPDSKVLRPSPMSGAARGAAKGVSPAISQYIHSAGGAARFACPSDAPGSVHCRQSANQLVVGPGVDAGKGGARGGDGTSPVSERPHSGRQGAAGASLAPALTSVTNTSAVIGLLAGVSGRASTMCAAGAYMHWYERYGCSKEAVQEAVHVVQDLADAYRLAHGVRDFL